VINDVVGNQGRGSSVFMLTAPVTKARPSGHVGLNNSSFVHTHATARRLVAAILTSGVPVPNKNLLLMHNLLLRWVHNLLLRVSNIYEFSFSGMPYLFIIRSVEQQITTLLIMKKCSILENKKNYPCHHKRDGTCNFFLHMPKTTNSFYYFDSKDDLIITQYDFGHQIAKSEIIIRSTIKIIHI
jgi:hypothetical protein